MALAADMNQAKRMVETLQAVGYRQGEISVLVKDNSGAGIKEGEHAVATGVASGATTGGALGALGGLLVGLGMIAVPGVGPFLAGGPLLAALGLTGAAASTITGAAAGAVAGGTAGGILGAFVKAGLSEERAREYEARLQEGAVLVGVSTTRISPTVARQVFEAQDAQEVTELI